MSRPILVLFTVAAAIPTTAFPSDCPVTLPSTASVDLPSSEGRGWYGSDALAMLLPADGRWTGMGANDRYGDKFWLWRRGFDAMAEPRPDLTIDGLTLSGPLQVLHIGHATSAFGPGWSRMLIGLEFPGTGCWHLTATYRRPVVSNTSPLKVEQSLSFVVEVMD